jgi:hypothetical protein
MKFVGGEGSIRNRIFRDIATVGCASPISNGGSTRFGAASGTQSRREDVRRLGVSNDSRL